MKIFSNDEIPNLKITSVQVTYQAGNMKKNIRGKIKRNINFSYGLVEGEIFLTSSVLKVYKNIQNSSRAKYKSYVNRQYSSKYPSL